MGIVKENERAKMGDFFQHNKHLYVAVYREHNSCFNCDAEKKHACLSFPTGCTGLDGESPYVWIEYLPIKENVL